MLALVGLSCVAVGSLLVVETELVTAILDLRLVTLLKVLGQDDVAVLAHGLHASFLADGGDRGIADLVWARYIYKNHAHTHTRSSRGCSDGVGSWYVRT